MKRGIVTLMSGLLLLPVWGHAKPQMKMERFIEREVSVTENGKKRIQYEPVKSARVGDVLVLKYRYSNVGDETIARAQAQQAIPKNMKYLSLSTLANGDKALLSVDGGKRFIPAETVSSLSHKAGNLTHIQWQVGAIKAGEIKELGYRVQLLGP